jgi:hypothetical protein
MQDFHNRSAHYTDLNIVIRILRASTHDFESKHAQYGSHGKKISRNEFVFSFPREQYCFFTITNSIIHIILTKNKIRKD